MGFKSFEIVSSGEEGGTYKRYVKATPTMNAPGFVQKVLGKSQSYEEHGELVGEVWRYRVTPNSAGGRISINGSLTLESLSDDRCRAKFALEAKASIPLVGKKIESFILGQFEDNLRKQEAFAKAWLDKQ
ncbi:MAG: DUF2505 domain-containing protein [Myxococcales bacterium]|nr:DUF2505 domain-containing protein [Myxococcales bacterium]